VEADATLQAEEKKTRLDDIERKLSEIAKS
jgi:hypothetical protein